MNNTRIALLGFGNVGRALASYLSANESFRTQIEIAAVADSSGAVVLESPAQTEALLAHKNRGRALGECPVGRMISNQRAFISALPGLGAPVLVESLPTNISDGRPALDLILPALSQGTNVVTVDKGPLVRGFHELRQAALTSGARLAFTGTTGVAIPPEIGASGQVTEIRGVLNGTTNYILSEMQQAGAAFSEALQRAQQDGIAEPDPSLDLDGWDTACKILILARALMSAAGSLEEVNRHGIGPQTESLIREGEAMGRVVKLIGRARIWQGRVRLSVAPKLVGPDSPFFSVAATSKAAIFRTGDREFVSHGRSGRDSIAETIVEDILRVLAP